MNKYVLETRIEDTALRIKALSSPVLHAKKQLAYYADTFDLRMWRHWSRHIRKLRRQQRRLIGHWIQLNRKLGKP